MVNNSESKLFLIADVLTPALTESLLQNIK